MEGGQSIADNDWKGGRGIQTPQKCKIYLWTVPEGKEGPRWVKQSSPLEELNQCLIFYIFLIFNFNVYIFHNIEEGIWPIWIYWFIWNLLGLAGFWKSPSSEWCSCFTEHLLRLECLSAWRPSTLEWWQFYDSGYKSNKKLQFQRGTYSNSLLYIWRYINNNLDVNFLWSVGITQFSMLSVHQQACFAGCAQNLDRCNSTNM